MEEVVINNSVWRAGNLVALNCWLNVFTIVVHRESLGWWKGAWILWDGAGVFW